MNVRYFVRFSEKDGFFGEIAYITSKNDLYNVVRNFHGNSWLYQHLFDDDKGNCRAVYSFSEDELLDIFRSISRHEVVELVSFEDLKGLSNNPQYLTLCEQIENNIEGRFIFNGIGDLIGYPEEASISELKNTIRRLNQKGHHISASRLQNLVIEFEMNEKTVVPASRVIKINNS